MAPSHSILEAEMDMTPFHLFNKRVSRLESSRLGKRMENPCYRIQVDKIEARDWIAADGVVQDDVDAFVLSLRLLMQDRDGFSVRCLSRLYKEDAVPADLRRRFNQLLKELQEHRRQISVISRADGQGTYVNKELFDIIMYGGLAHNDPKMVREFYALTSTGAFSAILFGYFLSMLRVTLLILKSMRDVNAELIERLRQAPA